MIALFLHVLASGPRWRDVLADMLTRITNSGLGAELKHLTIAFVGPKEAEMDIWAALDSAGLHTQHIVHLGDNPAVYELPTLDALHAYCVANPTAQVCYLHTKGASKPDPENPMWKYWRRAMFEQVIDRWQEHITALATHDTSGPLWAGNHYAGNCWWANAAWVASLPAPTEQAKNKPFVPHASVQGEHLRRLQAEFWLAIPREHKVPRAFAMSRTDPATGPAANIACAPDATLVYPLAHYDRVYIINLQERTDRKAALQSQLDRLKSPAGPHVKNIEWFPAINAAKLGLKAGTARTGAVGCWLSHYLIMQDAMQHGYHRILILEDDAVFHPAFNELLDYHHRQLPNDWEADVLGYYPRKGRGFEATLAEFERTLGHPAELYGTQAYALQGDGIRKAYELLSAQGIQGQGHIDMHLQHHVYPKLNTWCCVPSIVMQSFETASDIHPDTNWVHSQPEWAPKINPAKTAPTAHKTTAQKPPLRQVLGVKLA